MVKHCPFKMSALKLATLSSGDRNWILCRLAVQHRQRIKTELHQLGLLGIANHGDLLAQVLHEPEQNSLFQILQNSQSDELGPLARKWLSQEPVL